MGCVQVPASEDKSYHLCRDVQWLGKMWNEFYSIPSNHSADAYVDPFDDYIEETDTYQEIENNAQGTAQIPVEIRETGIETEEPIAARTRSHDSEPIASRARRQHDLTDIAGFADVKQDPIYMNS